MVKIKGFIIHLDRADERKNHVETLRAQLPFETSIVGAVDGKKLNDDDIKSVYQRPKYNPKYPFPLSKSEIACFLSHRKAWQAIVDQNLDGGFIIEDDVVLKDDFSQAYKLVIEHFNPSQFVRFPFRIKEEGEKIAATSTHSIIRPCPVGLGQVAQLVGREAAQKLLDATQSFDRPVDTTMQLFWETGVVPLSVLPGGVSEISSILGGSTIQKKPNIKDKLKREILRPLYRFQIKRRSFKTKVSSLK